MDELQKYELPAPCTFSSHLYVVEETLVSFGTNNPLRERWQTERSRMDLREKPDNLGIRCIKEMCNHQGIISCKEKYLGIVKLQGSFRFLGNLVLINVVHRMLEIDWWALSGAKHETDHSTSFINHQQQPYLFH